MTPNCLRLTRHFFSPQERSQQVLCNQLQQATEVVENLVYRPLLPFQKDALVCLVSDILGGYASSKVLFPDSFLLKAVNKGSFQLATAEFSMFCFIDGKVDTRAWNKRICESRLFSTGRLVLLDKLPY